MLHGPAPPRFPEPGSDCSTERRSQIQLNKAKLSWIIKVEPQPFRTGQQSPSVSRSFDSLGPRGGTSGCAGAVRAAGPPRSHPAPRAPPFERAMEGLAALPEAWQLFFPSVRAATFRNWPFTEGCACTPERMAAAGFVHCPSENSPDVAQCVFCLKELEGWEPDDDPLEEHKKHSADCAFLSLQKGPASLTLQEFLKLDKMRMGNALKKEISQKMTKVEEKAKIQRCSMMNLA